MGFFLVYMVPAITVGLLWGATIRSAQASRAAGAALQDALVQAGLPVRRVGATGFEVRSAHGSITMTATRWGWLYFLPFDQVSLQGLLRLLFYPWTPGFWLPDGSLARFGVVRFVSYLLTPQLTQPVWRVQVHSDDALDVRAFVDSFGRTVGEGAIGAPNVGWFGSEFSVGRGNEAWIATWLHDTIASRSLASTAAPRSLKVA